MTLGCSPWAMRSATWERVGTEVLVESRCGEGRLPGASRPCGSADGSSFGCWEEPGPQSCVFELGDVVDDLVGDRSGEYHGSVALGGLGWSDDYAALNVRCCSADTDQVAQRVEVAELKSGEFTDAESSEGTDQDKGPISGVDRVGEPRHLFEGEWDRFAGFDLRELDVSGGGEGDEAVPHGQPEHAGCDLPRLLDSGRCFPVGYQGGHPRLEVGGLDAPDRPVAQMRKNQRVEIRPVPYPGGFTERGASRHPPFRYRCEQNPAGSRIDPFSAVEFDQFVAQPTLRVDAAVEGPGPPPPVRTLVPGSVSSIVASVDGCPGHDTLPRVVLILLDQHYAETLRRIPSRWVLSGVGSTTQCRSTDSGDVATRNAGGPSLRYLHA